MNIDEFVNANAGKINKRFYPKYHFSTPIGWINDPNGFSYAFGRIHLFCQFYPYATNWGHINWGHAVSEDFVKWQWLPVALKPDKIYEEGIGIMSGTATEDGGNLLVCYASGSKINDVEKQQISLAISKNGVDFEKFPDNPVIKTEQIPAGYSKIDFRDPKIFKENGKYYVLVTSRDESKNGKLLLFSSTDLHDWEFIDNVIKAEFDMRGAFECPDFFRHDGKDVILCSPQFLKSADGGKHQNVHSSVYMTGRMDLNKGSFEISRFDDVDSGMDFYAPQSMLMPDGRRVVVAWMNNWDKDYPSAADGWVGSMTLPREVRVIGDELYQSPVRELNNYRKNPVILNNIAVSGETTLKGVDGNVIDIELEADVSECEKFGVKFFANEGSFTEFYYDVKEKTCYLDRTKGGIEIKSREEKEANIRFVRCGVDGGILKLRILLDVSCAEIFIGGGKRAMTATVFNPSLPKGVKFFATGGVAKIITLKKYDIEI